MKTVVRRIIVGFSLLAAGLAGELAAWQIPSTDPKEKGKEKDPLVTEAEQLFRKGEVDNAFKKLEAAVKKTPTLPPARLMLARLMLSTPNQGPAGRQLLEFAMAERPDHPDVYLTNASIALAERRITDTILNCRMALTLADESQWTSAQRRTFKREAHAGLATAFEARKAWDSARKHLSDWIDLEPDNASVRQRLARALFHTRKSDDEVLEELRNAVKVAQAEMNLDPPEVTMGQFYSSRAQAETDEKKSLDDLQSAEKWYKKAIEANAAKKARPHLAYGGWLLDNRRLDEAEKEIAKAKAIDPDSRETQAILGLQARYKKDYPAAEKIFQALVAKTPDDFFSLNQLALVLIELGSAEKRRGVKHAENNAARYQQSAEALATLAWTYFRSDRFADAEKALATATSGGQASADTAYYLARMLHHKKDYKRAYTVLEQALKNKGVFVHHDAAKVFLKELELLVPKDEKKDPKETDVKPK